MEWLCDVFGFTKRLVVSGPGDSVLHSELSFGNGVIMVSSARPGQGRISPRSLVGVNMGLGVWVDAHFARTRAVGAEILQEL